MGEEIERKFLVVGETWRDRAASRLDLRQGYLCREPERTVRVRLAGAEAFLTVKGRRRGVTRSEFEYAIPVAEAAVLLDLCAGEPVTKTRWRVPVGDHLWEVDEFHGANAPLVLAEIELSAEDEAFVRPDWLGTEVSTDDRYTNSHLAAHPWGDWPAERSAPFC